MSPNRVPEKRVGLALLLIGGFSFVLYVINSANTPSTTDSPDPLTFFVIVIMLMIGVGLRSRFKDWGEPPPPPKAAAGAKPSGAAPGAKGGFLGIGSKRATPPPVTSAKQPPPPISAKPKGLLGKLDDAMKPKNKK